MGRSPCCDKVGVKKGPWTPEEDIMLVSYVQEHGPRNWKAVPASTGLKRCSKSCRLRWTNYLRPGIKRGSFTDHEEKMIIELQALLGNKWAAIASYLPERTDNDIKNYWNTHLKKKLKKQQSRSIDGSRATDNIFSSKSHSISIGQWEKRLQDDINTAKQALHDALSCENTSRLSDSLIQSTNCFSHSKPGQPFSYASSTENIARLLRNWVKNTPNPGESKCSGAQNSSSNNATTVDSTYSGETPTPCNESKNGIDLPEAFDFLFGFDNMESSNSDEFSRFASPCHVHEEIKPGPAAFAPLSMPENLLLDDEMKDYLSNYSLDENPDLF